MKTLRNYLITTTIGLLIFLFVILIKDIFSQTDTKTILHIISDGLFVSGVLLTCSGLLTFTRNQGSFDMIFYGFSLMINKFRRDINARKYKTFYDYREAQKEKKRSFAFICITGLCFIALSGLFIFLWSQQ